MKSIKQLVAKAKNKARSNDELRLAACFGTKESHGNLFLTYNGVAFHKVEPEMSAQDVIVMLNKAREAAIHCALG